MFALSVATSAESLQPYHTISAIASGILWVQTNDGRFDEQLAFLQDFNARYPGDLFATTSLVKCRVIRGEVEHAESIVRDALAPCASLEMARDFVYWSYALFNPDDILDKLPTLRRNYPALWRSPAVSTALRVLQSIEKYGGAEDRKDDSAVYCVNLPDDKGRWRRVEAAFGKLTRIIHGADEGCGFLGSIG